MYNSKHLITAYILALIGFSLLFLGISFNFWGQLSLTIILLGSIAIWSDAKNMRAKLLTPRHLIMRNISYGLITAALLYAIFIIANIIANWMFQFSNSQISAIYELKNDGSTWVIPILIVCIIGPGEEFFWRGYLQEHLQKRYGSTGILLAILAYISVHLASGNLMLIAASGVCGIFWAFTYYKFKSLWLNIISHAIWDLSIFVIWPIGQ